MKKVAICTDTNSGFSNEEAAKLGIFLLPMPFFVDGKEYFENVTMESPEFFERLRAGAEVSTSQPSPGELTDMWDKALEEYDELVHIPMSSGLSSSCATASALAEEYNGRVQVADNRRISITMLEAVMEAKRLADKGMSAADIKDYLEKDALNASIYITVNTLEYLKKSGRVTPAAAAIGTVLNIKPVLQIQGGKLDAFKKVRGINTAVKTMTDAIAHDRDTRFAGKDIIIRTAYSGDPLVGLEWNKAVSDAFPNLEIESYPLPISICCHVGEGALGIAISEKKKDL